MNDDERAEQIRSEEIRRLEELVAGPSAAMAFPLLAEAYRRAGRADDAERVAREGLGHSPHVAAGRVALALALLDQKRSDDVRAELERLLGRDTEHAIAGAAAARAGSDAIGLVRLPETDDGRYAEPDEDRYEEPGVRGEIATLDPYPEESERFGGDTPADMPFGTPPPPAAAEPLVFDGGAVDDDELDDAFAEAESDREQMFGADEVAQAALATVPEDEDDDLVEAHPRSFVDSVTASADAPFATETVAGLLEQQGHADDAEALRARIAPAPERDEPEILPPPEPETITPPETPDASPRRSQATLERWLDNLRRDRS
ncbi:MAG: hypothetical protein HKP30_07510 [Myxococcales bacterium]|nr:hypothetical protein [Myxococcales bacterium]